MLIEQQRTATGAAFQHLKASGAAAFTVHDREQALVHAEADDYCRRRGNPPALASALFEQRLVAGYRVAGRLG